MTLVPTELESRFLHDVEGSVLRVLADFAEKSKGSVVTVTAPRIARALGLRPKPVFYTVIDAVLEWLVREGVAVLWNYDSYMNVKRRRKYLVYKGRFLDFLGRRGVLYNNNVV